MGLLLPALQKYYNALKHLEQFSVESSFFENIGNLDVFFSEYRSVTFALQTSLGGNTNPVYQKHLAAYLVKDEKVAKWLNDQRVTVIHQHPFKLKKILRIVIYDSTNAAVFKTFEQTLEAERSIGDYEQMIRDSFLSIIAPEINFSAQYIFVNEEDKEEINVFNLIDPGVVAMWQFLHAMFVDLAEKDVLSTKLMAEIDSMVMKRPQRWMIDALDYCYYRSTDSFEGGQSITMLLPDIRIPQKAFFESVKQTGAPVTSFFDAFIWMHAYIYIKQNKELMSAFFIEYEDGTYRTLSFSATLRTTYYRYINRVAELVSEDTAITTIYLVSEFVSYGPVNKMDMRRFIQMNYREKEMLRKKTLLGFFMVPSSGQVASVMIDADDLVDRLSISTAMGNAMNANVQEERMFMLTPIINSFKNRRGEVPTQN